ncbi:Vacuolar protein sorting-associated protein 3 [Smittium culicis]|uniref:Vacuolar protein sorting-associated protein 3 n=1 Tax=Smittium culicis TaxID=133412 RepID=A0A1R1YD82_9FUNG|nr:Vacuolar protein sorting-associated protein 3 [Smittium culicis]
MADIKSYKIINLENIENVVPLVSIPNSLVDPLTGKKLRPPRPRVGVVGKNEFIILTISSEEVGSLGVIVGVNGDARRGTLQFPEHPRSFIYDSPYIIALFSDGRAEFHNTHTSEVVEYNFISPNGKKPRGVAFVSSLPTLAMSGELEDVEISISEESNEYLKNFSKADFSNRYSDFNSSDIISNSFSAHVVVYYSETVKALIKPPKFLEICNLLDEKRVEEAIDEIELSLSKSTKGFHESREIKFLYQRVSLIFLESLLFDDALEYLKKGYFDPRVLLSLFSELFSVLKNIIDPLESLSISKAIKKSVKSMRNINTLVKNGSSQFTGGNSEIAAELELTLLQNANDLLFRFLIYCNKVYKDYEHLLPVCTSLALLYSDQKETEKYKELLYDQKNFVDCDVVVNYCNSKKNYYFASLAYKIFEKAEQTLNIWEDILSGKIDAPEFKGEVEYLNYITELKNEELTSKRFYKILNFNTSLAVKMFYKLSPGTVAGLNTDLLIAKFEANGDDEVLGNFIQRLVEVHHSKSPVYSTLLVQIRIRDIGRWLKNDKSNSFEQSRKQELENSFRIRQNSDMSLSFRDFLVGMINSINKVQP